jgi:predicted TIM-barrel fold metal-dependent hydrolase
LIIDNRRIAMKKPMFRRIAPAAAAGPLLAVVALALAREKDHRPDTASIQEAADSWRNEHRLIDLHLHIACEEDKLARAVKIMDEVGIGVGVNLSGGTTLGKDGKPSEFERNKALADTLHPRRFIHYMNLDYGRWDEPDFSEHAVRQIEEGYRLGAAGLKEYKRLGLYLKDKAGALIGIDDPRLDPVWKRCGELGFPISIHVADPVAFWRPYDENNERWTELKDHRSWWFGDSKIFPPHRDLLEALDRVIARHPNTTFVCVHFANNSEDLAWVELALDRRPNMMADLAARIPEIGRHAPEQVRRLFLKHQDRLLFGTDFMVYDRLILGSGGSGPAPTDRDAVEFFDKHWRWMETNDRQFAHMTPIQGDWKIDAIGLPGPVLRKIYFDNARKLLRRVLPPPTLRARRSERELAVDGILDEAEWRGAETARIDCRIQSGEARPEISTAVRALWTGRYLYLAYEAPFESLTTFDPPQHTSERPGLWDRDVVEAFLAPDPADPSRYFEFEVAPTGEKLDLSITPDAKDIAWSSGFAAAVSIDAQHSLWRTEMRIPLTAIDAKLPVANETVWRLNLYRHAVSSKDFVAWNPTATGTAHTPDRFGFLEFVGGISTGAAAPTNTPPLR